MTPTPKDIATAVPADFRLPWNTTRTMADVWGISPEPKSVADLPKEPPKPSKPKLSPAEAGRLGGEAKARNLRRVQLPPPRISPRGKITYAGYDASEVQVKRLTKS